jgi:hypothetical protein
MRLRAYGSMAPALVIILAASACSMPAVPASNSVAGLAPGDGARANGVLPTDTTSILKKLTKDVVIGSTVDAKNGDEGPRALSIVPGKTKLPQGDLVACNFEDSAGNAGDGTTIEILSPKPKSKPTRFAQSDLIKGCDGDAINVENWVFGAGLTSGKLVKFSNKGAAVKTYSGKTIDAPFSDADALPKQAFSPEYLFAGTTTGGLVSIGIGHYGNGEATEVANGFAVSHGSQGELAPSGLQYDRKLDTLYIVDGATNTIVAFSNVSDLLEKDEITVGSDGKTFKCKHPSVTCGTLVYSGSPLDAPIASALLPNGNLIVANTQGTANTLVELTPQGQVLDTKVIDKSSTQGVFGLAAGGTGDSNTVLYFTDTNSNDVQELEQ